MSQALAFIPLRKVDEEQRLVYGIAAEEVLDKSGEIMDYETSRPNFEAWSSGIAEATGGSSLGNLRAMHQPVAAGKLTDISFDDDARQVLICAKVVDDGEWNKVLEGVYTGFSMGGSYAKKWKDAENPGITRYTALPIEISLVDNPCVPTAHFEVQKANGLTEMRKFQLKEPTMTVRTVTNEEVAARATQMAKAAGDGSSWIDHLEPARVELEKSAGEPDAPAEPEATETPAEEAPEVPVEPDAPAEPAPAEPEATEEPITEDVAKTMVSQVWMAPDGTTHATKAAAVAVAMGQTPETPNPVQVALKAAQAALKGDTADFPLEDTHEKVTKAASLLAGARALRDASGELSKGYWNVANLADVLRDLGWATDEAAWCCDGREGSVVPDKLAEALRAVCVALTTMANEEVAETLAHLKARGFDISGVEGVEKSVLDELQAMMGDADGMEKAAGNLAKRAPPAPESPSGEALTKMVTESPLFKALETDRDELKKQVGEAVEGIGELRKQFAALGKQPTQMAPRTQVVEKAAPSSTIDPEAAKSAVAEMMKTPDGQRQLAEAAFRATGGIQL